jgi:hypothetical protein
MCILSSENKKKQQRGGKRSQKEAKDVKKTLKLVLCSIID